MFFPLRSFLSKLKILKMATPITCHVLNTLSGTPAAGLDATLTLLSKQEAPSSFAAVTDADGRVKQWQGGGKTLEETMNQFADGERVPWSIKFDIGTWYDAHEIESFWPEIEVKFYVKKGERHYHVPVLVGPWTYTTYRGS